MKRMIFVVGLMGLTACTTMEDREARCKCFNTDGTASGLCDFTPLTGQPVVFSFMANRMNAVADPNQSLVEEVVRKEICGV